MGKEDQVQAFRLFDFDKSEEYKAYMRNIELPPGDNALLKAKAKFYKRTQDPDFEIDWLPGLAASQAAPTPAAAPAAAPAAQQPRQAAPAAAGGGGGAAAAAGRSAAWQQGRQLNLALLQVMVVAFSFLYLQPLHRGWSSWAYSKLMLVLVFSQALKVNTAHGWPAAWNLAAVKQWLMRVVPTSDAQYFLLAFAAAGNSTKPITAVLPPFLVMAAYTLAHFLSNTVGSHPLWQRHGVHLYRQMQAKQQVALAFTAQSEIMLGFLLLLGLPFPSRAPVFAYMVANFLRMRYWSADGALYHRQAWASLGNMTAHFRHQFPILQRVVDFGVRFFHQGQPGAAP